jgi:hypothetical protein
VSAPCREVELCALVDVVRLPGEGVAAASTRERPLCSLCRRWRSSLLLYPSRSVSSLPVLLSLSPWLQLSLPLSPLLLPLPSFQLSLLLSLSSLPPSPPPVATTLAAASPAAISSTLWQLPEIEVSFEGCECRCS